MSECSEYITTTELYLGHDNSVSIVPYSNMTERINYDMTAVTSVTASADLVSSVTTGDDVTASSADVPITVWWDQDADDIWVIHLKVGLFVSIVAGEYKLRVVIIDPAYPNGLVIADDLLVTIVDIP
jgi:hypothetical protein